MTRSQAVSRCGAASRPARSNQPYPPAAPDGGFDAIVSMQVSAAESGVLRAGSADGQQLQLLPLPYPLLADI